MLTKKKYDVCVIHDPFETENYYFFSKLLRHCPPVLCYLSLMLKTNHENRHLESNGKLYVG